MASVPDDRASPGQGAWAFIARAQDAACPTVLTAELLQALRPYDFRAAAYVRLGSVGHLLRPEEVFGSGVTGWLRSAMRPSSPAWPEGVRRIFAAEGPFDWPSAAPDSRPADARFKAAAETAAVCVPIFGPWGEVGAVVLLAGRPVRLGAIERATIGCLATCYAQCGHGLVGASDARRPALTPRELECLGWAARGKSDWATGGILRISERTAHMHIEKAKRKLGAQSRLQAILAAWRFGLLLESGADTAVGAPKVTSEE